MPANSRPDGAAAGVSTPLSTRGNTLYDILGIAQTATTGEITTAYRKLALVYHPDRADGSTDKFQELQRAYELLNDPNSRSKYDLLLKGKPALKNFKRPATLAKVEKAVYALLADLAFYEFEAAPSRLRCSFHYGDGIEFNGERGSFIGLAGDGYLYWSVNGRGYATQLCNAGSDMALSNVRIVYRSNMGLTRKPLERSRAGNYVAPQRSGARPSVGGARSSASSHLAKTTGGAPRLSEAERIREQLRSKERHRSATKRLETIEKEEADERNYLERKLWENFCMLHTNLEAGMRCVTRGLPVTAELAMFMGYLTLEEVPLVYPMTRPFAATAAQESPQTEALWVDPLEGCLDNDDEGGDGAAPGPRNAIHDNENDKSDASSAPSDSDNNNNNKNVQSWQQEQPSTSSSAPSRADNSDSDAASDGDSCRARPTAGQDALNRTNYTAAYVSPQDFSSSPMAPGGLHHLVSATSSFGNVKQSPSQPDHRRSVSWNSSPGANALPTSPPAARWPRETSSSHAPHAIHTVSHGGSTTVQYASGAQRPLSTAAATPEGRETEGHHIEVASCQETDQPSSFLASLVSPPTYAVPRSHGEATTPSTTDVNAERFVTLMRARSDEVNNDGGDEDHDTAAVAVRGNEKVGRPTSPRPLYPWSSNTSSRRDSLTRVALHEPIPDPALRRTAETERSQAASAHATPAQNSNAHDSGNCPAGKGSLIAVADAADAGARGKSPSSPPPLAARERTSTSASPFAHAAATTTTTATVVASQVRPLKPSSSSPDDSPLAVPHGLSINAAAPRIVKFRTSSASPSSSAAAGQPATSAASGAPTPEVDALMSPRPMVPSRSSAAHKTAGPAVTSGRSAAAHSQSRGESGDGCTSYGVVSGTTMDHSLEEGPRMSTQSLPCASESAAAQAPPMLRPHHVDVVEGAVPSPLSSRANCSATIPSGDSMGPADASATCDHNESAATASTTVVGESTRPQVAMAPLRLSTSQDAVLQRSAQDGELDPFLLSPNTAALEKRRRSKGRVTPRYMLATEAHARRVSGLSSDATGASVSMQSPRLEAVHAYNSMTAEEMLAEEEEFMSSFAKTKRAI